MEGLTTRYEDTKKCNLIFPHEEPLTRPHSEAKTWAPSCVPSAPQSAPPELAAQHKSQHHSQHSGYKSPESESVSLGSFGGITDQKEDMDSGRASPCSLPTKVENLSAGESVIASGQEEKVSLVKKIPT